MEWPVPKKTHLEPDEVIKVAYLHLIMRTDQHVLAATFGVNQGRINEAVTVMREAAENHMKIHKAMAKSGGA